MDPSTVVLLAEDDMDEAFLIQRAFKDHGLMHPPHLVADGTEVLTYLLAEGPYAERERYRFPNMLILDLKMQRMDGFAVLQWLQEHPDYRVIPTVVWSASSDARDVKHAYCLGANAYLCKPTDYGDFKAMLGRLLAHWDDCLKPIPNPGLPECDKLAGRSPFNGSHGR